MTHTYICSVKVLSHYAGSPGKNAGWRKNSIQNFDFESENFIISVFLRRSFWLLMSGYLCPGKCRKSVATGTDFGQIGEIGHFRHNKIFSSL